VEFDSGAQNASRGCSARLSNVPTFGNGWPYFVWLIVTAVALYYLKWPVLLIAALVGFVNVWLWLCHRFPRTMWFVSGFLRGLMGGRRRR
jgi:hypothetical protein